MNERLHAAFLAILLIPVVGLSAPLTILYTNDLHLRFSRLESVTRWIDAERSLGTPLLLLDAGDAWQDTRTLTSSVWGAEEMVDWMNRVEYDAMALGNHELYWGPRRLDELLERATFPVLCANLIPTAGVTGWVSGEMLRDVGGLRVHLVGLITRSVLPYIDYPWLRYIEPSSALQSLYASLEAEDSAHDLRVVVAHLSVAAAFEIVRRVDGIDVFITGHSHEKTEEPIRVNDTIIVQAGAFGRGMGRLKLDVVDGVASVVSNEILTTEKASVDVDRGLRALARVAIALVGAILLVLL